MRLALLEFLEGSGISAVIPDTSGNFKSILVTSDLNERYLQVDNVFKHL